MVGSAICRRLQASGYANVLTRTRLNLDLLDQGAVHRFLAEERPDYVFISAAKVGGIHANKTYRADFVYQNLVIEANLIHGAHLAGIQHLMFLGSSCIYPRDCPQPILEEYLLTGPLEQTNEPYAVAKIAGIKLCESYRDQYERDYISVMSTNLYGPNDSYDLEASHVLPALICKAHDTKVRGSHELVVWGSGRPRREFLFVDDLAEACVLLLERQLEAGSLPSVMNIGFGEDISIRELAETVMEIVGCTGEIRFDNTKPDGTLRRLLDSSRIVRLGWRPRTTLRDGIRISYQDYLSRIGSKPT
jgi:GDP-L-fucose synthase